MGNLERVTQQLNMLHIIHISAQQSELLQLSKNFNGDVCMLIAKEHTRPTSSHHGIQFDQISPSILKDYTTKHYNSC